MALRVRFITGGWSAKVMTSLTFTLELVCVLEEESLLPVCDLSSLIEPCKPADPFPSTSCTLTAGTRKSPSLLCPLLPASSLSIFPVEDFKLLFLLMSLLLAKVVIKLLSGFLIKAFSILQYFFSPGSPIMGPPPQ